MMNCQMRPIGVTAMVLILFFMQLTPLSAKETEVAAPEKVAIVNGKAIDYVDFERDLEVYENHYRSKNPNLPPDFMKKLRTQVVNEMVNQELLYQDSQKKKIKIDKERLEKELDTFHKQFPSKEQYQAWLKKMRFSEEGFQSQFAQRLAVRDLIEKEIVSKVNIKEEEAKAFYDNNQEKFRQKESVRARHILIKLETSADDKAKANARQTLTEIKKKLLAGEEFAVLAKAHSQGPSNVRGGDLGYFSKGQMVKPFEAAAFKLAINEVSDIVETRFGYHLIKVLDHKTAQIPSFEEVKDGTMKRLNSEQIQKDLGTYVDKLRKSAKVETFLQ